MAPSMREEIVFAETEDGLSHGGVLIAPSEVTGPTTTIVWIHGAGCHFYIPTYIGIGRALAERGYTFLSGNTRGHDMATLLFTTELVKDGSDFGALRDGGTFFEDYHEVELDIAAWIDQASARGAARIILAGHSLGGSKVVIYQAARQDRRIAGLVVASPGWWELPGVERLHLAHELMAAGQGDRLMPPPGDAPERWPWSAQHLVSLESVKSAFSVDSGEPRVAVIQCPLLAFFGTKEDWSGATAVGFANLERLRREARSTARLATTLIEGADHMYRNTEAAVANVIADWAMTL